MAKFTFKDYEEASSKSQTNTTYKFTPKENAVTYFSSLKKAGDYTFVRFFVRTLDDLDIETCHKKDVGNMKNKSIACLRTEDEKTDKCPLCKAGVPVSRYVYVKFLEYVETDDGKIVAKPRCWERKAQGPNDFVKILKYYYDDCGDLTGVIFRITRMGEGLQTTYNVAPVMNQSKFSEDVYVKDFSAFDNFKPSPMMFIEASFEQLEDFVKSDFKTLDYKKVQPKVETSKEEVLEDIEDEELPWDTKETPTPSTSSEPRRRFGFNSK